MKFFKLEVRVQHKQFESIYSVMYLKRKQIELLLYRLSKQPSFFVYFTFYDLKKKDIIQIFNFYGIKEYDQQIFNNKEIINNYVQDKNIRFK